MTPAGRIVVAAALATTLVSGTAAALDAAHAGSGQVASTTDVSTPQLKGLDQALTRLEHRADELSARLRKANHGLETARRAVREAQARQAAAAAWTGGSSTTTGGSTRTSTQRSDDAPATDTTTGASSSTTDDGTTEVEVEVDDD